MILMLATACKVETPRIMRVNEAIKNIHALNGKTVQVAGYLGECVGYDCGLFEHKQDSARLRRIMAEARSEGRASSSAMQEWLRIGSGDLTCPSSTARTGCIFSGEKLVARYQRSYVVVTGVLNSRCRDNLRQSMCTDRRPDLEPLKFEKWTPPGNAP